MEKCVLREEADEEHQERKGESVRKKRRIKRTAPKSPRGESGQGRDSKDHGGVPSTFTKQKNKNDSSLLENEFLIYTLFYKMISLLL